MWKIINLLTICTLNKNFLYNIATFLVLGVGHRVFVLSILCCCLFSAFIFIIMQGSYIQPIILSKINMNTSTIVFCIPSKHLFIRECCMLGCIVNDHTMESFNTWCLMIRRQLEHSLVFSIILQSCSLTSVSI